MQLIKRSEHKSQHIELRFILIILFSIIKILILQHIESTYSEHVCYAERSGVENSRHHSDLTEPYVSTPLYITMWMTIVCKSWPFIILTAEGDILYQVITWWLDSHPHYADALSLKLTDKEIFTATTSSVTVTMHWLLSHPDDTKTSEIFCSRWCVMQLFSHLCLRYAS